MKRLFALLLCLCLCLALIPAAAAEDIEIVEIEAEEPEPVEREELIALVEPEEPAAEAVPNAKPSISSSPKSVTAYLGTTVKFTVKASGAESYQWYYRTSSSGSWAKSTTTGAKTATLSIVAEAKRDGYQYRCKVSNADGYSYTKNATLTVSKKPVVTEQPADAVALAGETVKFTVKADGATSYQWYYRKTADGSWNKSSGATGASLSVEVKSYRDGYQYRCKLTNANGYVYSEAATLSLLSKPKISTQPFSYTACVGATVYFKVQADVADSYQWYYRTSENGSWKTTSLTGCKTATLTVKVTAARDGWQYRCKLTNSQGSSYSDPATLTVADIGCGEGLTWKLGSDGTLTVSGKGPMEDAPGKDSPWDNYTPQITRVSVGSGVTRVGNYAFFGLFNLSSVSLPSGITEIGDYAFGDCEKLTSVTVPAGVTSIGAEAFSSCKALTTVKLGSGLKSIGTYAFGYCFQLTSVNLPDGLEEIGENAFRNCTRLPAITIPDSVTSLGDYAFEDCSGLKTVKIGAGVTSIGTWTFYYCSALESVTMSDNVTYIGFGAFYHTPALTSITLSKNLTTIDSQAFSSAGLTSVTIPDKVTSIGSSAFSWTDLKTVTIGKGVKSIGNGAFSYSFGITDVYYRGTQTQWNKIEIGGSNDPLLNATFHFNA